MIECSIGAHQNLTPDSLPTTSAARIKFAPLAKCSIVALFLLATSACETGNFLLADGRTSFVDDANLQVDPNQTIDAGVNPLVVDAAITVPTDAHGNPYRNDAGSIDASINTNGNSDAAVAQPVDAAVAVVGTDDAAVVATNTVDASTTGSNNSTPDAALPPAVPTLAEDCDIRWGQSTGYNSNVEVMATDDSFLISGFRFDSGETAESDSALDGSQIWIDNGQGYFGAANSGTMKGIYNSCGGGGLCVTSIDLATGTVEASSFYSAITAGWSTVGNRFAVQPTGEFIMGQFDSPIDWNTWQSVPDWQIQPDSTVISDVGPGSVLFRHAADGSFAGYLNIPNTYVSQTIALSDGRWSVLLQNWGADPAPMLGLSLPAQATSLVTLAADFSSASLDASGNFGHLYNVAGTTLRVVDDGGSQYSASLRISK